MDRREKESLDHWLTTPPDERSDAYTMEDAGFGGQDMTYEIPNQRTLDEAMAQPLEIGGMTIDDIISMHLTDCNQCADAQKSGPVRLGQKSGHCSEYWHLQWNRAEYEGRVNNVVARTEHGDEAPIRGRLD